MILKRQEKLLEILNNKKYKADVANGRVYSYRKNKDQWQILWPCNLPNGYKQHCMSFGRGKGLPIRFYEHIVIYIAAHGTYPEGMLVDHIDGDRGNNKIGNLRLLTPQQNKLEGRLSEYRSPCSMIRGPEITKIIELHNAGYSQAGIAKYMGINRLTIRYHVNKYKRGETFRYIDYPSKGPH